VASPTRRRRDLQPLRPDSATPGADLRRAVVGGQWAVPATWRRRGTPRGPDPASPRSDPRWGDGGGAGPDAAASGVQQPSGGVAAWCCASLPLWLERRHGGAVRPRRGTAVVRRPPTCGVKSGTAGVLLLLPQCRRRGCLAAAGPMTGVAGVGCEVVAILAAVGMSPGGGDGVRETMLRRLVGGAATRASPRWLLL
jgi:hypothetical protein